MGNEKDWDKAEKSLEDALKSKKIDSIDNFIELIKEISEIL